MLNNEIMTALKQYTANMQNDITLVLGAGEHEKRAELLDFLTKLSSVSSQIKFEERETDALRSPISFMIEADGKDTGIRFSGLPGGHEFNSLVLAILHSSGTDMKLDDSIEQIIGNMDEELNFQVYVSLSCHNCPDVVQTLNKFALINDKITSETIDGGVFPELIE